MAEREVVVVTGASGGVGRAVAREFARHGAAVGLIARGRAGLDAAAKDVEDLGGVAYAHQADVAEFDEVSAAAAAIEARLGPIDVWINNAMTTVFAFLDDIDPHEYERATRVTYLGAVWGTKVALARMLPRDRGTIVQVGSALAYRGIPLQAPYCGAKHAMKGMFESLAVRGLPPSRLERPRDDGPAARDEHAPVRPLPEQDATPPDAGAADLRARGGGAGDSLGGAPSAGRELYVGLPTVYTIIGNKLAPWLAERYLAKTAVDGQQTDQPFDGAAAANLFEPVDDDHDEGSRGSFDDKSHTRSEQAWLSRHRLGSELAAAAVTGVAAALLTRRRARGRGARPGARRAP